MGATLEHVRAALPHGESTSLPARLPACRHPRSRRACLSAWRGVQVRMLDESLEREGMRLDDAALRSDELVAIVRRYGVPPLHNIFNMCVCACACARVRVCVSRYRRHRMRPADVSRAALSRGTHPHGHTNHHPIASRRCCSWCLAGVRRENARMNTGSDRFAFRPMQVR